MPRLARALKASAARVTRAALGGVLGLSLAVSFVAAPVSARQAAPAAAPEPALWAVTDADSTVYLFGTVHLLRPETAWRTPRVQAAIDASDTLYLEIVEVGDEPAKMAPLVQQYGIDPANPLSGKLTAEELAKLDAAARTMGLTAAQMEPMRPWLAALTLSVTPLLKAGYDPNAGVDKLLHAHFTQAGKPVKAFEQVEQQLRFFADLPPELELTFLRKTLDDYAEASTLLDQLAGAWARGDVETIDRVMIEEMKDASPELYKVLIVDRNADWAGQIEQLMAGSGTAFVAVGAGHLVGSDSVQAQLEARGLEVERR